MEIQGYSNYLIYEDGRVYSKKSKRFLTPYLGKCGYIRIKLCHNAKPVTKKIHRLIAEHYIPNPENKPEVDHINRNRQDYRIENLRWVTKSENEQNKGMRCNNTSGIKNIGPYKNGYRYVKVFKGKEHIRQFKTLEEAIQYKEQYEKSLQIQ